LIERNQTRTHVARIIVIGLEAHGRRLLLDADPDAEQEDEEK
jgi:hypothetical protein